MNMVTHQAQNSVKGESYNIYQYQEQSYLPHFHKNFELAYLVCGTADFTVRNRTYAIDTGAFILVLPYELHSFQVYKGGKLLIIVFSENYIKTFSGMLHDKQGEVSVFQCSQPIRALFEEVMVKSYVKPTESIESAPDLLLSKACLYAVCSEFLRSVPLHAKDQNTDLLIHILNYIEQNFREDISVKSAAKELGYHHQYISRIFNQTMHINFKSLVNQYRFEYARRLLTDGSISISEAAFESGFQSIRTFNRIYRELSGHSPRQRTPLS